MGLTSALNTALFGLTYNQKQLDVTAANVANADTQGYSTKQIAANVFFDGEGNVSGILSSKVTRVVDLTIQKSYFGSLAETNYASQISEFTARLDELFGTLEDGLGLNTLMSELSNSLTTLVNDPSSYAAQQEVVSAAESLAFQMNRAYESINEMRETADNALQEQAEDVNSLLRSIEDLDARILEARNDNGSISDLMDQRDRYVEQLSGLLDVVVSEEAGGTLLIRTHNGNQLLANNQASIVSFQPTATLRPGQEGNTIVVTTPGGTDFDLISSSDSGSIKALAELRDEILVEAQTQLDTLAAELSLAFSNVDVASTATTVGVEEGFVLDLSALQAGNTVTLDYTDSTGTARTVTFVAVEDAALLPLDDTATARSDDTVYGIDISSGNTADYVMAMIAALAATDLAVSDDGSGNLQILGDTGTNTTVESLKANVTPSADTGQGLGLSIFVDTRNGEETFTDSLEGGGQRLGYASGIAVNSSLRADSSLLVTYQTSPANSLNDSSRPEYLLGQLTGKVVAFDPDAGIGSSRTPYQGSLLSYVNQIVAHQGDQASDARSYAQAQETLTTNLAVRYEESYSVNVDEELAFMVELQNAYAANARVMQAIDELFDVLLNTV
ncbi:flagellar hook-associated protein FlgK [Roseibium aestuarii]|uniref:Flagellar hook-associated protein 1 n=1 Tax=Roseibium aestuarii TaxID=2600299 RepID=A0ABW4JYN1_9HYPH|nr:flagellar hook-associated protein FlgK [Roseibium aestuarii]